MDYLLQYKKYLRIRNYSSQTITHYISDLRIFKKSTGKNWRDATKGDVAEFVIDQVNRKFRPKTINRRLYVIKGFYSYLKEELDWEVKNPVRATQFIRRERRLPYTLEDKEIEKLLAVITDTRDQAIIGLMLRCGLRVSEVANLQPDNINLFRRELRILGKGKKERVVPIPNKLLELLVECTAIRPKKNPKFFWNKKHPLQPIKINSIQWILKRYAQKAGIEVHCHTLRHCFARQMTENGLERTVLRDLMGHANIGSTDVYGRLSDPFIKESYFQAMEKILGNDQEE